LTKHLSKPSPLRTRRTTLTQLDNRHASSRQSRKHPQLGLRQPKLKTSTPKTRFPRDDQGGHPRRSKPCHSVKRRVRSGRAPTRPPPTTAPFLQGAGRRASRLGLASDTP